MFVPRLLLAAMIGIIISEPLVLFIFKGEITSEMVVVRQEKKVEFEKRLLSDPRFTGIASDKATIVELQESLAGGVPADAVTTHPEVQQLTSDLAQTNTELAAAESAVACEGSGTCGSGTAGAGPVFAQNLVRRDRLVQQQKALTEQLAAKRIEVLDQARVAATQGAKDLRLRLTTLQEQVARTESAREAEIAENDRKLASATGLLAQIGALHRLTAAEPTLATARYALLGLILAVELLPVLFKLMQVFAKPTTYDMFLQDADEADLERTRTRVGVEQEEARMHAQVALDAAELQARTELAAHLAAARAVMEAQVELVKATASKWREQQERRLEDDLGAFLDDGPGTKPAEPPGSADSHTMPGPAPRPDHESRQATSGAYEMPPVPPIVRQDTMPEQGGYFAGSAGASQSGR